MSENYHGMRWLKCDLQMQTPADKQHWLGKPLVEGKEQEAAFEYAEACYQSGLDVVGITEHNFLNRDFLIFLERAFDDLYKKHAHRINLFPGFEFEAAGVGRGVHILCLFEPNTSLEKLDSILTECGVGVPRIKPNKQLEKSDKNLKDILRIVQDKHSGIVIMPHATSNDGIFDNDSISDWLQQEQFTNSELLAIEVPKPVHLMSKGYQRLLKSGGNCQEGWRRERPIAVVMSSDNKMLIQKNDDGRPMPNSIGYRYSWIKMSSPSIESLRQAFLDPESRIKLPEDVLTEKHPEQLIKHGYIKSIKVEGVEFLEDQEVHFSPHKNSFIGGRGSGKSTLQEYLRIALSKHQESNIDDKTRGKIERIESTLKTNSKLTVYWVSDAGVEDEIVWEVGGWNVSGKSEIGVESYLKNLPVQFFSQQQLNQLTESEKSDSGIRQAERLLGLIDAFDKEKIAELKDKEKHVKAKLEEAFTQRRQINELQIKEEVLQAEYVELERQWKARSEIQSDATRHQQLKAAQSLLQRYKKNIESLQLSFDSELCKFSEEALVLNDEQHPFFDFFNDLKALHNREVAALQTAFSKAQDSYKNALYKYTDSSVVGNELNEKILQADDQFELACEKLGLSAEDANQLKDTVTRKDRKQEEFEDNKKNMQKLIERSLNAKDLMTELHELWRQQFEQRRQAAEKANGLVEQGEQKFLKVSVSYQHNEKNFSNLWGTDALKPDRRTRLGKNWTEFGEKLRQIFIDQDIKASPWELLDSWLESENPKESLAVIFEGCEEELITHITDKVKVWEDIKISRIEDVINLKLYRSDGTLAGSIADNSLSDGQRNTAALVLLLAQGEGPLVIDQPEDELDSNFVSKELIPMLRTVKPNRQLILATHNANLPVNGDAELVYAFEAINGKGVVRACGGLDRSDVKKAILDIMEGSKEAFTSRREKYGF